MTNDHTTISTHLNRLKHGNSSSSSRGSRHRCVLSPRQVRDMDVSPLVCFLFITLLLLNNNLGLNYRNTMTRMMNSHHCHHGNNRRGTGQGKGRVAGARDPTCLEPLGMFLFFFLSTKLLFTFRNQNYCNDDEQRHHLNTPQHTSIHRNSNNSSSSSLRYIYFFNFFCLTNNFFLHQTKYICMNYNGDDEHTLQPNTWMNRGGSRCVCISRLR